MAPHSVTSLTPPRLASLPAERAQLEFSSRSLVFVEDGRRLVRAWGRPERPWVVAVEPRGDRWAVEAWGAGPVEARAAARAMFSLDHPIEEFYRLVRADPALRGTERKFRGLRLPRDAHLYEALLHAIVGQQLSVAAANALKRRLFARTGATVSAGGLEVPCAPRPAALRSLGPDGLRGLGISSVKARALDRIAAEAGRLGALEDRLSDGPREAAVATLTEIPGVGPWTAENALLRGVGRRDVFVAGDLALRVALEAYAAVPRTAPESRARAWGERRYPGWGSYATLYLWRKLVADRSRARGG